MKAVWFAGGLVAGAALVVAAAVGWWTYGKDYDDQAVV